MDGLSKAGASRSAAQMWLHMDEDICGFILSTLPDLTLTAPLNHPALNAAHGQIVSGAMLSSSHSYIAKF